MQPSEADSHRYHTRRRALLDRELVVDLMGDRKEGSPPRGNRNEDQENEFFRAMVIGQQQMAQAMQALTTMVERMGP